MFRNLLIYGLSTSKPNLRLGLAIAIPLKNFCPHSHKKWTFHNSCYKTWLCIISWGISAWNMSKMKQRWRKGFCSLLFIVTKVVCKNWKACGYTEEEETSSVDQTPPPLSLSQSLDVTSSPLHPLILELYIKPRPYNTVKEVGRTQNIEADWCLKEAKRAENSWFIYSLKYSQSMWQSYSLS